MEHFKNACKIQSVCLWLSIFLTTAIPHAYSGQEWSTSFNCSEWEASAGNYNTHCDGISLGDWGASCEDGRRYSQITSAAKMSENGRGFRYWVNKGKNNGSSGTFKFVSSVSEFWAKFYMRIDKDISFNGSGGGMKLIRPKACWFDYQPGNTRLVFAGSVKAYSPKGMNYVMGGPGGDGEWHLYEFYLKFGANGAAACWIDGEEIINEPSLDLSAISSTDVIQIPSNQEAFQVGCKPIDIDDIAISTTGRIGPLNSSTTGSSSISSSASSSDSSIIPPAPGKPWVIE